MSRIYLSPPHVGSEERRMLVQAFDSNWIAPCGPDVDAFEKELAARVEVPHAVALASGTAALHLALGLVGVRAGDEVLTSSLTFAATAFAIKYVDATPVFVDSTPATWNMDPALLDDELGECARKNRLPKAVLVVDLYGQCADHDAIAEICQRWDVPIIEDAAEALGATYKGQPAGSFGQAAAFSFNGNKILTTSGGGMLVSHDQALCDRARFLSTQAREPEVHYEHRQIGYNYRLSNLLAALGRAQLKSLDERIRLRRENNRAYREALADIDGISFVPEASYGRSNGWLTCILLDEKRLLADPRSVQKALERENIETRPVWKPMHLQPVFAGCRARGGRVSEDLFRRGLCLPSGSSLSVNDRERVVAALRQALRA